jgi:hypothetical protein
MAKVILENSRSHDITLHLSQKDQVSSVTIPAAKQNPQDREQLIPGRAEVDGGLVAATMKSYPVVKHYFDKGWLKVVTPASATKSEAEKPDA